MKASTLVSLKDLARTCKCTRDAIVYLVKRGQLTEDTHHLIDLADAKTKAVISRFKRRQSLSAKKAGRKKGKNLGNNHASHTYVPVPKMLIPTGILKADGTEHYTSTRQKKPVSGVLAPLPAAAPTMPPIDSRDCATLAVNYANDVVNGEIEASEVTTQCCQRFLDDLTKPVNDDFPFVYDTALANERCHLIERMPHIKGKWAKEQTYLRLEPWQCFAVCNIFGWVHHATKLRRFREVYWEVPRKNAKSTVAAAIGNVMMCGDGEFGAEVYAGATNEKQAWEVFGPARLMIKNNPSVQDQYLIQTWAKAMVIASDNSKFWPVIGKPGDGASPSCAIVDEYHEHPDSDLVDTMTTGMGAREQPLLLIITTAGVDLASPCYDKHKEAINVLNGTFDNEQLFVLIYTIDEGDDWTDPAVLRKVNPNIGVSVDEQFLIAQQRQAVQNPTYQTRFKTKHLNIWCQASVAGINLEQWKACGDPSLSLSQFSGEECWESLDLASKVDICDKVILFRRSIGGSLHYYAFAKHYLPERTIEETHVNANVYRKWQVEGKLVATPGAEVDFDLIRDEVKADSLLYSIREVVYDPWRATQLAHQLATDGALVVEMAQNPKNMGEAFDEFTSAIKSGRFHHDGDPVLEWMASNVVQRNVAKGLVVPSKDTNDAKIDGVVAIVMAISRTLAAPASGMMDWLREGVRT